MSIQSSAVRLAAALLILAAPLFAALPAHAAAVSAHTNGCSGSLLTPERPEAGGWNINAAYGTSGTANNTCTNALTSFTGSASDVGIWLASSANAHATQINTAATVRMNMYGRAKYRFGLITPAGYAGGPVAITVNALMDYDVSSEIESTGPGSTGNNYVRQLGRILVNSYANRDHGQTLSQIGRNMGQFGSATDSQAGQDLLSVSLMVDPTNLFTVELLLDSVFSINAWKGQHAHPDGDVAVSASFTESLFLESIVLPTGFCVTEEHGRYDACNLATTAAVPLPASGLLLMVAIGGLGAARRRFTI